MLKNIKKAFCSPAQPRGGGGWGVGCGGRNPQRTHETNYAPVTAAPPATLLAAQKRRAGWRVVTGARAQKNCEASEETDTGGCGGTGA